MNEENIIKSYIVLAHANPRQLRRLIDRLNDVNTFFYVHIDLRSSINEFETEINLPNVFFIEKRIKCRWGDFSLVEATLEGMKAVEKDDRSGYCLLVSGQDYPIKTNASLNAFLKKNEGYDFVELQPVKELWTKNTWRARIEQYKFDFSDKREDFVVIPYIFSRSILYPLNILTILKVLIKRVPKISLILEPRQFPNYITPFAGSQWWAITTDTLKKILDFLENHEDYLTYNQYSFCPDEFFFHSIINFLQERKQAKVKPNLTFVNWKAAKAPSPEVLKIEDFEKLSQLPEPYFFARKFDNQKDKRIFDRLDEEVRQ